MTQKIVKNGITYTMPNQIVMLDRDGYFSSFYGKVMDITVSYYIVEEPVFRGTIDDPEFQRTFIYPGETLMIKYLTPKQFAALKSFL
jgi:hypothetical protein